MSHSGNKPGLNRPIFCVGESLIDLISPDTADWSQFEQLIPRIGGAPANTAVAITRLGGRSALLGTRADDPPGQWIQQRLSAEGVDVSNLQTISDSQTRLALVTGPADDRDFTFYGHPAADTLLTPEQVDAADLENASAVIFGSLGLAAEPSRAAFHRVLEICRQHRTPLAFDPNPRPQTWPDPAIARDAILPFIEGATILKLSAEEPARLSLTVDEIRARQPDSAVLVITDGPRGCCYWYGNDGPFRAVPISVDAVDSTGAGDAFTAALTLRYVEDGNRITPEAIDFASVVGALTTTSHGAMDALPDRHSVESALASR